MPPPLFRHADDCNLSLAAPDVNAILMFIDWLPYLARPPLLTRRRFISLILMSRSRCASPRLSFAGLIRTANFMPLAAFIYATPSA